MQQPLAIAIIAGLIVQMPLVLVVILAIFRMIGRIPVSSEARHIEQAKI